MSVICLSVLVHDENAVPVNKAKVELSKLTLVATSMTNGDGVAVFSLDSKMERIPVMVWVNGKTTQKIFVGNAKSCKVVYTK